ncbi:2996_t:CDS:1, partial [Racocetra persica]
MSSRILRSKVKVVDKRKRESDNHVTNNPTKIKNKKNEDDSEDTVTSTSSTPKRFVTRKEQRQGRINKAFVINQIDNFIKDISNQKRKASNENECIYNHEIE